MKRLGMAAVALAVALAAAVLVAVWASVGDAPWERVSTAPTAAPTAALAATPVSAACVQARKAYDEADRLVQAMGLALTRPHLVSDNATLMQLLLAARQERIAALGVMNEACR